MIKKSCFHVAIVFALLAGSAVPAAIAASAAPAPTIRDQMKDPGFHVYSVTFGLRIDPGGKLQAFRIVKIVEPSSGSSSGLSLAIPQAYIDAARKKVEAMEYAPTVKDGKQAEVYINFMFTPTHPDVVITNLYLPIDHQR